MHDVAWRGMWICVRSKDAQKQLARTSLTALINFQQSDSNSPWSAFVMLYCLIIDQYIMIAAP